jgi:hypothetical protein
MRLALDGSNPFVRKVITGKGNIPSIILYTDAQIADVRRFCCSAPMAEATVLGVDKTYNLCDMYVTVFCFKNLAVTRPSSEGGGHPLFIGPILIHADSTLETYCDFFNHLRVVLGKVTGQPIIGSDDEKAIKGAILNCFPQARTLYCVRHLKDNVGQYLTNKGVSEGNRRRIISHLFGRMGVAFADGLADFLTLAENAKDETRKIKPEVLTYISERIIPLLKNNFDVYQAAPGFPDLKDWNNNNCESINHVLKMAIQWKPQKLLDLIEELKKEVEGKYAEVERALLGRGDFILCPEYLPLP